MVVGSRHEGFVNFPGVARGWILAVGLWSALGVGLRAAEAGLATVNPDRVIVVDPVGDLGSRLDDLGRISLETEPAWLDELWLLGRYHGQYHWSDGSLGEDQGYETRRARFGFQARLLERMTVHAQMISGRDFEPFYNGFTELWIGWKFDPRLTLTIGQQKHRFTHDRNVSSRYINYLERAQLTNMFRADYTPAINLSGQWGRATYHAGVFSNATGRDIVAAFSEFNSGRSLIGGVYYELEDFPGVDSAHINVTGYDSTANRNATNLNVFGSGLSSALILTRGAGSLITEVTGGFDAEQGDAGGFNLQPALFLTDRLQVALRYQMAVSDREEGLLPQNRYEAPAGLPPGELYQAGYAGLNYYLARHRLKLMSGIEYASMDGEDVWTASTMFRFYFGPHSGSVFPTNNLLHKREGRDFLEHD